MLLRKGVKNANLVALRDPQFCHFKLAPLRRTWVAPLGRSSTIVYENKFFSTYNPGIRKISGTAVDPSDRVITAQSAIDRNKLITKDQIIRDHYEHAVW